MESFTVKQMIQRVIYQQREIRFECSYKKRTPAGDVLTAPPAGLFKLLLHQAAQSQELLVRLLTVDGRGGWCPHYTSRLLLPKGYHRFPTRQLYPLI